MYKVTVEHFPDGKGKNGKTIGVLTFVDSRIHHPLYQTFSVSLQEPHKKLSISDLVERTPAIDQPIWVFIRKILNQVLGN